MVDLDAEKGQAPRVGRDGKAIENKHRVAIKFAKKVQLATTRAYLEGKMDFDNGVLEGISKALCLLPNREIIANIVQISLITCCVKHLQSR